MKPRSNDKRSAILAAAVRAIDRQGLRAPTAVIAREASIATGSLFTYFATKSMLFNELYLELKRDMVAAASAGLRTDATPPERLHPLWSNWTHWAVCFPQKRRVLAQLEVSDDIAAATRARGQQIMGEVVDLVGQARAHGPMRETSWAFVAAIMNAVAEATMDLMLSDSANAERHCQAGFEVLRRVLS
ncbi:MAG: TetR/AcrR family transcriptional regulator [Steroidobacteraceae bacterium]